MPISKIKAGGTTYDINATALETEASLDGLAFDGGESVSRYGVCSTAAATADKVVNIAGDFDLAAGACVIVKFANANTAASPTLNVNGTGAKSIKMYGAQALTEMWQNNAVMMLVYDGTNYMALDGGMLSQITRCVDGYGTGVNATNVLDIFPNDVGGLDSAENNTMFSFVEHTAAQTVMNSPSQYGGVLLTLSGTLVGSSTRTQLYVDRNAVLYYRIWYNNAWTNWQTAATAAEITALTAQVSALETNERMWLNAYAVITETGNPVTIDDGADDVPVKALLINIKASQTGTPTPSSPQTITGQTSASATINGDTVSVGWTDSAGTIYGGTLDVTTGILTKTHEITTFADLLSVASLSYNSASSEFRYRIYGTKYAVAVAAGTVVDGLSTIFSPVARSAEAPTPDYSISVTGTATYLCVKWLTYNDDTMEAFKAAVASAQIVLPLRPQDQTAYQLTAQEVNTLLGSNTFSTNQDSVTVQYRADPTLLYEKLTNAIISLGGNI